ncbi:hypothetical protein ATZ36_07345 [Candidatus Endomicrobiellum trichonymphae]|uniref:Uncharacterized protein n=1 Tax=Endomicrobium trichonymphae TaxID=1408204 RepID=A0A1E5IHE5_ENDTX|nr:hypothetical protein ATZ36_07345 [Candidatus Endomicrobium trichonymphae]
MIKLPLNKPFSKYPKPMANTELGSPRQVQEISTDLGKTWTTLTNEEKQQLRRGQFAFGSIYPYIFDGLAYVATHNPKLLQKHDKYYFVLELPIEDWCGICLGKYQTHNKERFIHELLRRGSTLDKDEAKHLRCIPIEKGEYISIQPLIIGFTQKSQEELHPSELKKLMNLRTFNETTKKIKKATIYVLKLLIEPFFNENTGGWFSCPSALQAKIYHTLETLRPAEKKLFDGLEPLFLRKYFLYLNLHDGSHDTNYVEVDELDLCEHVAPAEIVANGKYRNIRDWNKMREKLTLANEFFMTMETKGLMKGAKAYPTISPKGVFYDQTTKQYCIFFKRSSIAPVLK